MFRQIICVRLLHKGSPRNPARAKCLAKRRCSRSTPLLTEPAATRELGIFLTAEAPRGSSAWRLPACGLRSRSGNATVFSAGATADWHTLVAPPPRRARRCRQQQERFFPRHSGATARKPRAAECSRTGLCAHNSKTALPTRRMPGRQSSPPKSFSALRNSAGNALNLSREV